MTVLLLFVAGEMLQSGLGSVLAMRDPELALLLDPNNGEAQSRRAEQLQSDSRPESRAELTRLSRSALARSPVMAPAARTLALSHDVSGDHFGAMRLINYAESISRRDFPTQVVLIQLAIARNDIPNALHHYDIALTTTEASRPFLFPVLIAATAHPEVVDGLARVFAQRPSWGELFIIEASQKAPDLDQLADLLCKLHHIRYPIPETAIVVAIGRMVDQGRYTLAQRVYSAAYPGSVGPIRDGTFAATSLRHTAFDWRLSEVSGVMSEPIQSGGRGLSIHAVNGSGGVIASQLIILPAGEYQLTARLARVGGNGSASVRFICARTNTRLAEFRPLRAYESLRASFVSPPNCEAQWAQIVVDGGDDPSGFAGEIGPLSISALRSTRLLEGTASVR